jgi:hypothetical protein
LVDLLRRVFAADVLASQAPLMAPARAPALDLGPEGARAVDLVDNSPDDDAGDPGWTD